MQLTLIGGTRFIGRAIAERALERGHAVATLHRGRHSMAPHHGVTDVLVDRKHPEALITAIRETRPDVVLDTRAMTGPDAEVTALALRILSLPAVVLSSQDVYAAFGRILGHAHPPSEAPILETSPLTVPFPFRGLGDGAREDYDKKEVEAVFEEAPGRGVVVLRLPATYGSHDYQRRFGGIVDRIDAGERELPCQGGASFRWTHAHVRDVAEACLIAAENVRPGWHVYNVGERNTPRMRERVESLALHMGVRLAWREVDAPLPPDLAILGRFPCDVVVSSEAIRRDLGFIEVTTEDERMSDLVAWSRTTADRTHSVPEN